MTEKEFKPGSIIKKIGTEEPLYYLGDVEEYNDFLQYRLTKKEDINNDYRTAWDVIWLLKSEILRDYELVELPIKEKNNEDIESFTKIIKVPFSPDPEDVTTIDQSKSLIRLGLSPETSDCYWWYAEGNYYLYSGKPDDSNAIPAWSIKALLSVLPEKQTINGEKYNLYIDYNVRYVNKKGDNVYQNRGTSFASMLFLTLTEILEHSREPIFKNSDIITPKDDCDKQYEKYKNQILKIENHSYSEYIVNLNGERILIPIIDQKQFNLLTIKNI